MTYEQYLRARRREYWQALIDKHRGNVSAIAREAGIYRSQIYRALASAGVAVKEALAAARAV